MDFTPDKPTLKDQTRFQAVISKDESARWKELTEALGITRPYIVANTPKLFRALDQMSDSIPEVENLLTDFITQGQSNG